MKNSSFFSSTLRVRVIWQKIRDVQTELVWLGDLSQLTKRVIDGSEAGAEGGEEEEEGDIQSAPRVPFIKSTRQGQTKGRGEASPTAQNTESQIGH